MPENKLERNSKTLSSFSIHCYINIQLCPASTHSQQLKDPLMDYHTSIWPCFRVFGYLQFMEKIFKEDKTQLMLLNKPSVQIHIKNSKLKAWFSFSHGCGGGFKKVFWNYNMHCWNVCDFTWLWI